MPLSWASSISHSGANFVDGTKKTNRSKTVEVSRSKTLTASLSDDLRPV